MRLLARLTLLAAFAFAAPASAQPYVLPADDEAARFVTSTYLATFYHEYGHALIHVLDLPVLGREEDAADSLSNILLHYLHEGEAAEDIIWDNALAWALLDAYEAAEGLEWNFAGVHSLTPQRYEQFLCEMIGADPETRAELAAAYEMDANRVAQCADLFANVDYSWGRLLEGTEPGPRSRGLRLVDTDPNTDLASILQFEIDLLNQEIGLPVWVDVMVAECGEFNAFYDPSVRRIIMCQEWAQGMNDLWDIQDRLFE
jgi:hypothetical protein